MNIIKFNILIVFLLFGAVGGWLSSAALAEDESPWIVAAVEGGAWKSTARDPSVRTTVREGDAILPTDRLETFQNNQVALARDRRGRDIVAVRGAFEIEQSEIGAQVRLQRGRALAVLDGLKGSEDFNIATLAGVAAVRGTRFSVEAPVTGMLVKTFEGEVLASAYAPNTRSRSAGRSVAVSKGFKTSFESDSRDKLQTAKLTDRDWSEYRNQFRIIRDARTSLKKRGGLWFDEASKPARSQSVPSGSAESGSLSKSGRSVVF